MEKRHQAHEADERAKPKKCAKSAPRLPMYRFGNGIKCQAGKAYDQQYQSAEVIFFERIHLRSPCQKSKYDCAYSTTLCLNFYKCNNIIEKFQRISRDIDKRNKRRIAKR